MGKCCLFFAIHIVVLIIMPDYLYANAMVIIWTWVVESLLYLPFVWRLEMGHWNLQQRVTFMGLGDNREVVLIGQEQAALTGANLNFNSDEMFLWKPATRTVLSIQASALSPVFVSICLPFNSRLGVEWSILIHSHPFFIPGW